MISFNTHESERNCTVKHCEWFFVVCFFGCLTPKVDLLLFSVIFCDPYCSEAIIHQVCLHIFGSFLRFSCCPH